jgi:hypothetical protein
VSINNLPSPHFELETISHKGNDHDLTETWDVSQYNFARFCADLETTEWNDDGSIKTQYHVTDDQFVYDDPGVSMTVSRVPSPEKRCFITWKREGTKMYATITGAVNHPGGHCNRLMSQIRDQLIVHVGELNFCSLPPEVATLPDGQQKMYLNLLETCPQAADKFLNTILGSGEKKGLTRLQHEAWDDLRDSEGVKHKVVFEGCTDAEAVNYDPAATENDSSCNYHGCVFEIACNYNPDASIDDGSCIFNCPGCTDILACNYDSYFLQDDGSCTYPGCLDMNACNYDANAGCDDDNCQYFDECGECGGIGTLGCNEPSACNYDITADCDDMSCVFSGCMDSVACNFDANAGCDDGACEYESCTGCMYELACNYDSEYTIADNESCEFGTCPGCTDSLSAIVYSES